MEQLSDSLTSKTAVSLQWLEVIMVTASPTSNNILKTSRFFCRQLGLTAIYAIFPIFAFLSWHNRNLLFNNYSASCHWMGTGSNVLQQFSSRSSFLDRLVLNRAALRTISPSFQKGRFLWTSISRDIRISPQTFCLLCLHHNFLDYPYKL